MKFLPLHLEAYLQSYGTAAAGWAEYRDTSLFPTKSALVGLLGCALGLREEDEAYKNLKKLKIYCKIRNGDGDTLVDFQIVRPHKSRFTTKSTFLNASGKGKEQFYLEKHYISDTTFDVYVGSESEDYLEVIYKALKNPVWAYYLGRACCTPSAPLIDRKFTLISDDDLNLEDLIVCI